MTQVNQYAMQSLLVRQAHDRYELEQQLYAKAMQAQMQMDAIMRRALDEHRIASAPDLWRRLDAARARHGLPPR